MERRTVLMLGAATAASRLSQTLAQSAAKDYPSRPVRLLVGFPPGGSTDVVARLTATTLQQAFGQPFIVENKPGAGSNIASADVARAAPDGYTLLLGTIANATNMATFKSLTYDTVRDLAPVSLIMGAPAVLAVSPQLPVTNLKELIELAKARPGQLSFSSSGAGGPIHLAGEMLKLRAGIDINHIPYKGAAQALQDTISGVVSMGFVTALSAIPHLQAAKLRGIAVAAAQRLPQIPDVPTMAEQGMADFEINNWNGVMAPARTPPAIIAKLAAECIRMVTLPDVKAALAAQAAVPVGNTPEQFDKFIRAEIEKWSAVAKAAHVVV